MKKIIWIATPATESEYDIAKCREEHSDLEIRFVSHEPTPEGHPFFERATDATQGGSLELLRWLSSQKADLFVFRHPWWISSDHVVEEEFHRLFDDLPALGWASEMGPVTPIALQASEPFQHIAANSQAESPLFQRRFPDRHCYVLPFGCTRVPDHRIGNSYEFHDIVADGMAHYACGEECWGFCGGNWKHQSVDVMITPLLGKDISLWGTSYPTGHGFFTNRRRDDGGGPHGWRGVPGVSSRQYRGIYPAMDCQKVYERALIYVGATWNWKHGGYGAKLARAMASKLPVVWHRTVGMEKDGLVPMLNLLAPSTAEETHATVVELLENQDLRHGVGLRGREFAFDNWEWGDNLKRIMREMGC